MKSRDPRADRGDAHPHSEEAHICTEAGKNIWCEEVDDGWLPAEWAVGLLHRGGVSQQLGTVSCIIQLVST